MKYIVFAVMLLAGCATGSSGKNCEEMKAHLIATKDRPDFQNTHRSRDGTTQETWIFEDGSSYEFSYGANGKCTWVENLPQAQTGNQ